MRFQPTVLLAVPLLSHLCQGQSACAANSNCLNVAEATNIALRYVTAFETDKTGQGTGVALIPSTFAPNFTYFDEGASFGVPGAVYHNRSELTSVLESSGYTGAVVTNVKYTLLDIFASCNMILLRWQSSSQAANATNVTAPVGTNIAYKGNDYLAVDLSTRLVYNATSSSDLLNFYSQLGDDVIAAGL